MNSCKNMIALTAGLLLAASPVHAAVIMTCDGHPIRWPSSSVHFRAGAKSFASPSQQSDLLTIFSLFEQNPSPFDLSLTFGDTNIALKNSQNEIAFTKYYFDEHPIFGGVEIGQDDCWGNFGGPDILESDVLFNATKSWQRSPSALASKVKGYGGSAKVESLPLTALHELGHSSGLRHEGYEYNVMGAGNHEHSNGWPDPWVRVYLGEDASSAMTDLLYGQRAGSYEDVAVTHWEWTSASKVEEYVYSNHGPVRLFMFADKTSPIWEVEGHWLLAPGEHVFVAFGLENLGKSTQTVGLKWFLSTNSLITTYDQVIGTGSITLKQGRVDYPIIELIMPPVDEPTEYWLGIIIDPANALSESIESNNATYLQGPLLVKPFG